MTTFSLDQNGPGNEVLRPITADGRTGFDQFDQLVSWSKPDGDGYKTGRIIRDVRDRVCYICGQKWELTTESLQNQKIDGRGNALHQTCLEGANKLEAYRTIADALISAGYIFADEEVEPRYSYSTPWQRVTVLTANKDRADTGCRVVLGRRKRVWEVRFHGGSLIDVLAIAKHFDDVTDTKGFHDSSGSEPEFGPYYYVHAWTEEQLVDYLSRFRKAIPAKTDRNACEY